MKKFEIIAEKRNQTEDFSEQLIKKPREVVLYGGGAGCDWAISFLKSKNVTPSYIIDKFCKIDFKQQIRIISLEEAQNKYNETPFFIIITTPKFEKEVKQELENYFYEEDIFSFETELYYSYIHNIDDYREYIRKNANNFQKFFDILEDEYSKKTLVNVLKGRVSGEWSYFKEIYEPYQYFAKGIVELSDKETFIDVGACDGDTLEVVNALTEGKFNNIYCLEPDEKCFVLLSEKVEKLGIKAELINKGAWNKKETLYFNEDSEHGASKIIENEVGNTCIQLEKIDTMIGESQEITHIKMDIEGAEYKALLGAKNIIKRCKPTLAICVYHKNEDILEISKLIKEMVPEYKLYLRHHNISGTETVLYAVI